MSGTMMPGMPVASTATRAQAVQPASTLTSSATRAPTAQPASKPHSLRVEGLCRKFGGVSAIDDVSFSTTAGTVHSIIGPNGAGKTTLINLLTGVYAPSSGRILFGGRDLTGMKPHAFAAAGIGRTFQNLQIFFNMTVLENVMTGRHLREPCGLFAAMLHTPALQRSERECRERALELLEFLGLEGDARTPAHSMPYGALKRLEIARALAAEPALLLLDEPAAGLNPTEAAEIDALIRRLASAGTTIILVEHNMRLVMGVSDTILVLDHGRRLTEGTVDEVRNDPRVIEAYLGVAGEPAGQGDARGGDVREGDAREGDVREGDVREGDTREGDTREGTAHA